MNDICTDNRFELIKKYKQKLIDATNIETSAEEMAAIDNIMFRFWQMGWLDKLETPEQKWIPVTERLPKDGEFVLVCNDDGHMLIAKYESEVFEWYYKYTNYDFDIWDNEEQGPVCYWMPLPEPPKEEH